jgi:hypothetical protein
MRARPFEYQYQLETSSAKCSVTAPDCRLATCCTLVSCRADFRHRRWRFYIPLKCRFACGLHRAISWKLVTFRNHWKWMSYVFVFLQFYSPLQLCVCRALVKGNLRLNMHGRATPWNDFRTFRILGIVRHANNKINSFDGLWHWSIH